MFLKIIKYILYLFIIFDIILLIAIAVEPPYYYGEATVKIYGTGTGTYTPANRKMVISCYIVISEGIGEPFDIIIKNIEIWIIDKPIHGTATPNKKVSSTTTKEYICDVVMQIPQDVEIGVMSGSIAEGNTELDIYHMDKYIQTEEIGLYGGGQIQEDAEGNGEYSISVSNQFDVYFRYEDTEAQVAAISFFMIILIILILALMYIRKKET